MKQVWFSFVPVLISSLLDYGCTSPNCNMTCHKDARCEVQGGTTGCYCSQGYTGNGITVCKGKQVLPMCLFVICSLGKLTQEPTSSRIKLYVTTVSYTNMLQRQKSYCFLRNCPNYSQPSVLIQRAMHLSCVWPVFQLSFSVGVANASLLIYLQQFPLWLRISEAYGWCGGYCTALSSLPHTCSTWPLFPAADHHQITAPGLL